MSNKEPIFNIRERLPLWFSGILLAIHLIIYYGPQSIERFAGYWALLKSSDFTMQTSLTKLTSLIGHGFLHGSWMHLFVNCGMLVAFGVVTIQGAKIFQTSKGRPPRGSAAFFLVFFAGVIIGGLGQWLQWGVSQQAGTALGASGGVSALFASTAWAIGGKSKMIQFGFAWLLINIILIFAGPLLTGSDGGVAWAAHLAGYLGGALVAPFCIRANSTRFTIT